MKFCTPFDDALGAMKKGKWRPTPAQLETHPSPPCLGRELTNGVFVGLSFMHRKR